MSDSETLVAPAERITPEMIEAGRSEITDCWLDFISEAHGPELWGDVLSRVFRAMRAAQPQSRS